ncbi:hypothetical protein VKUWNCZY_CDS0051 [Escherichia phage KS_A8]|nr:MAG TPA: hypothetical protein [Caudoviricetes sp.]DAH16243.1 MAG TPA: hypothetical protein [Bacteriophage sp.]
MIKNIFKNVQIRGCVSQNPLVHLTPLVTNEPITIRSEENEQH